jgi:predicted dehydrogenase
MTGDRRLFRWGVLGTGYIARKFALGLKAVSQEMCVSAVCSRTEQSARAFADTLGIEHRFTSYEDLLSANVVDAIYIATPPHLHAAQARMAIEAGCPVLVEKPFCVNAAEAEEVARLARTRSVFCMEAMWSRFLPLYRQLTSYVETGAIGEPRLVTGSFCLRETPNDDTHLFDRNRGGGVILDRAVYPISLASMLLGPPATVQAQVVYGATGVDEQAAITLTYPGGCIGQFLVSFQAQAENGFSIMGSRASVHVTPPIYRPFELTVHPAGAYARTIQPISRAEVVRESHGFHQTYQRLSRALTAIRRFRQRRVTARYSGNGYSHQAVEVMNAVRANRTESELLPLEESVRVMRILDAIKASGHLGSAASPPHAARTGEAV